MEAPCLRNRITSTGFPSLFSPFPPVPFPSSRPPQPKKLRPIRPRQHHPLIRPIVTHSRRIRHPTHRRSQRVRLLVVHTGILLEVLIEFLNYRGASMPPESLFAHPLHPYTQTLSAAAVPTNPIAGSPQIFWSVSFGARSIHQQAVHSTRFARGCRQLNIPPR